MKKLLLIAVLGTVSSMSSVLMAAGDIAAGKQKSAVCAACHNADGNSASDAFPKLAGQNEGYIAKQLTDFKSGARESAIMAPLVAALSEQDMQDLGAYFASQKTSLGGVAEELIEAGEAIFRGGNQATGVPACMACHGPNGSGVPAAGWPKLSGQFNTYVETQLRAFASGERSNDANDMMRDIASRMSEAEIKAVSAYVYGLK